MPTNLPPEYYEVEERYRAARDQDEKIRLLDELISTVPKHKGTDKLRADLRRKLSKLRESSRSKAKVSRHESPYQIDPEGAGQVPLVGPANTGKSSLVNALTNAEPEIAPYPFSTWGPTPGMVEIENIQVQLIDTPAIDRDFVEPDHIDLFRRADLLLIVVDIQDFPLEQLEATREFLVDRKIVPENLADEVSSHRGSVVRPVVVAVNKVDDEEVEEDFAVLMDLIEEPWTLVPVSAQSGHNLDRLEGALYEGLEIIRVYSKAPGSEPDLSAPFVLSKGSTVESFAARVHKDFVKNLKSARIWGSGEFEGQLVSRDHVLEDGDVIELRA